MSDETDYADDWAKEDCACGHRRYWHKGGTGACSKTRMRRVIPAGLPPAEYANGQEESPWDYPTNWPPHDEWPEVEQPCCSAFDYGEPSEPDYAS